MGFVMPVGTHCGVQNWKSHAMHFDGCSGDSLQSNGLPGDFSDWAETSADCPVSLVRNPGHGRLRLNSKSLVCTFRAFTQLRKWVFSPELRSLSKFSGRNADAKSAWLYLGDTLQSYGGQVFSCCLNVLETSQLSTLPLS